MAFFTALDSRAEIRGSRDPLGLVPLWSRYGRRVIGNITTASDSLRGFTTLLIGYWLAERLEDEDGVKPLEVFLRFEQIAAYSRLYINEDRQFRGERQARKTRSQTDSPTVGGTSDHQILSDQKTYGLWGLFSTPARSSGLLRTGEPTLTPAGREVVENLYLPLLQQGNGALERQLLKLVRKDGAYHLHGGHKDLAVVLARILSTTVTANERDVYDTYLVNGGPDESTRGEQKRLAALLKRLSPSLPFGIQLLIKTIDAAEREPGADRLAERLRDILWIEHAIVAVESAFLLMLARDGMPVGSVANELSDAWGPLEHIRPDNLERTRPEIEQALGDPIATERMFVIMRALVRGDYDEVLPKLIDHNAFIMRARGSDAWVRLQNDVIDVRYHEEAGELLERDELPLIWRSTYFIDALKRVIDELRA